MRTSRRTTTALSTQDTRRPVRLSRTLPYLATASIAALVLSACGGGDGATIGADGTQSTGSESDYRSFVSVNEQAMAAISAMPVVTGPILTKEADGSQDTLAHRNRQRQPNIEQQSSTDQLPSTGQQANTGQQPTSDQTGCEPRKTAQANGNGADDSKSQCASSSSDASASAKADPGFVDTMISDMSQMNDLPLKGVNPRYGFSRGPGYVIMGTNSNGRRHLLPWFVQFEGVGNQARNTRIQMRNLRVFTKSRSTGKWDRLIDSDSYGGMHCDLGGNYHNCPNVGQVSDDDGASSTRPIPNLNLHGWWGSRARIEVGNIAAIVVSAEARLIAGSNGPDDRSKAEYLMHVGADYYPEDAPQRESLPPVGISRSKRLTNEWQTFSMSTINDVGLHEPGGGISSSEFRANPPPRD